MTLTTPAPPPLPDEVDRLLRRLRLPYVRKAAPEVIATATAQRWEPAEVLRVLLAEEAKGRDQATIAMRRRASGLPAGKTFDAWDENASPIPNSTQQALRTLEWIGRAEALCVCGPSGTGKSHRRGARPSRDRPRQDGRLAHARVARDAAAPPPSR
jgi:DNA replication protein DnaC